jgi:hypothetical protein
MIVIDKQIKLELGRKVPIINVENKGLIYLKPSTDLIANRPKILTGANIRLFPLRNTLGAIVINHTEEEYNEIKDKIPENFWDNLIITIPPKGKVYNLSVLRDLIEFRMIFLYPVIASNKEECTFKHLFYIEDLQSDAIKSNKKIQLEFKALQKLYNMTINEKIEFLALYEHSIKNVTPEIAENKLAMAIKKDPGKFLEYFENEEKTRNNIDFSLAIQNNVIRINGSTNEYIFNKIVLGNSKEEALKFFSDIKNQKVKMAILEETQKRMYSSVKV